MIQYKPWLHLGFFLYHSNTDSEGVYAMKSLAFSALPLQISNNTEHLEN